MKKSIILFSLLYSSILLTAQTKKTISSTLIKKSTPITNSIKKPLNSKPIINSTLKPLKSNPLKNKLDSASYALGIKIIQNLKQQGLDTVDINALALGMKDFSTKSTYKIKDSLLDMCIGGFQQEMMTAKSKVEKEKGLKFLEENKKRKEVTTLPSGLQYEVLKMSDSTTKPTIQSKVKCHYHGTLIDGTIFDSSVERGQPAEFPLANVIRGWQEGLQLMTIGSKFKFYIPSELGYGDRQAGPKIKPGSTLIFEVELLEVAN